MRSKKVFQCLYNYRKFFYLGIKSSCWIRKKWIDSIAYFLFKIQLSSFLYFRFDHKSHNSAAEHKKMSFHIFSKSPGLFCCGLSSFRFSANCYRADHRQSFAFTNWRFCGLPFFEFLKSPLEK
jgi:hypothetical protein